GRDREAGGAHEVEVAESVGDLAERLGEGQIGSDGERASVLKDLARAGRGLEGYARRSDRVVTVVAVERQLRPQPDLREAALVADEGLVIGLDGDATQLVHHERPALGYRQSCLHTEELDRPAAGEGVAAGNTLVNEQRLDLGQRARVLGQERAADGRRELVEVAAMVTLEQLSAATVRRVLEEVPTLAPEARARRRLGGSAVLVDWVAGGGGGPPRGGGGGRGRAPGGETSAEGGSRRSAGGGAGGGFVPPGRALCPPQDGPALPPGACWRSPRAPGGQQGGHWWGASR